MALLAYSLTAGRSIRGDKPRFPPLPRAQRKGNLLLAVITALVAQFGQLVGIALISQNGVDNRYAGQSRDVAQDFREFDIHLLQDLLHVLDMTGGVTHQHLPLPGVGTQRQHGVWRPERPT